MKFVAQSILLWLSARLSERSTQVAIHSIAMAVAAQMSVPGELDWRALTYVVAQSIAQAVTPEGPAAVAVIPKTQPQENQPS